MNEVLKALVRQFTEDPKKFENLRLSRQIKRLRPTDDDFSDEFFETFDAKSRLEIYPMMLIWVDEPNWRKILARRMDSEL
jgi:hypothetical protein